MRALISLIAGTMLLNLSAHAVSKAKEFTTIGGPEAIDDDLEDSQHEELKLKEKSWGFEKRPQDYENQLSN